MNDFTYTTNGNPDTAMAIRLEMLKTVNHLPENWCFDPVLLERSREYFRSGNQTTVLAFADENVIGCASICYLLLMPTFNHPTGRRAYIMNVYTKAEYRRRGIASRMLEILLEDARSRKTTEVSLDATEAGRPLYRKFGFRPTEEGMVLSLK